MNNHTDNQGAETMSSISNHTAAFTAARNQVAFLMDQILKFEKYTTAACVVQVTAWKKERDALLTEFANEFAENTVTAIAEFKDAENTLRQLTENSFRIILKKNLQS